MDAKIPTAQEVRQHIERAFYGAGPFNPLDVAACPCEECEQVRRDFAGVNTTDIEPSTIDQNFDKLPLFTPIVYRAVLPRFLLRGLDPKTDSSSWRFGHVLEFVVYALIPEREDDWWIERHRDFTAEQVQAIWAFLRYAYGVDPDLFGGGWDRATCRYSDDHLNRSLIDSDVPKKMTYWYQRALHVDDA